ncbi:MAG: hypothetical protein ACKOYM_04015, partial [Actinomycetes bacterium]
PILVQQSGAHYELRGAASWRVEARAADDVAPSPRAELLATTGRLSSGERREIRTLRAAASGVIAAAPLQLTSRGRSARDPLVDALVEQSRRSPEAVAENRYLSAVLRAGLVVAKGASADGTALLIDASDRIAELQGRTLSYWLVPSGLEARP